MNRHSLKSILFAMTLSWLGWGCGSRSEGPSSTGASTSPNIDPSSPEALIPREHLEVSTNLNRLYDAMSSFHNQEGRNPQSLVELTEKGYLSSLPEPPEGMQFVYDPADGQIYIQPRNEP